MRDTILKPKNRFTWALLAFQGGYVNVGAFLSLHIFVSHITGYSALLGVEIEQQDYSKAVYFSVVPIFFLAGAFFSSLFTEIRKKRHLPPVYIQILSCLSTLFGVVSLLGVSGYFGEFGVGFDAFHDFVFLSLLAFSCGAQNAIFTHYSKSIIRTTHMTGITTDLGIGLAKYFITRDDDEGRINKIRIDLILSFLLGSLAGAFIFPQIQYLAFLVPAALSFGIGLRLYFTRDEFQEGQIQSG